VAVALLSTVLLVLDAGPAHADGPTGFTNAANINLPGSGDGAPTGAKASAYPSTISVSGMTGTTSKVTVTLNGLTHTSVSDLRMLLVSPTGQNLTLMSNVGGGGSLVDASNATLTFDDAAAGNVPTGTIPTGTYKPTDDNPGPESFPAPAPAASAATALSTFNGQNPNGTWSLYMADYVSGDSGNLSGGWTITVTTGAVATPGTLQFSSATYSVTEGTANATITVERVGGSAGAVSATFNTVAGGTAVAGSQYTTTSQSVNFIAGQLSQTVNVPILDNVVVEGSNRTVNMTLSAPTGGASLGLAAAVLTITDNDSPANASPITIPATVTGNPTGAPAAPYPSGITISGRIGTISDVNVTLTGLTHSFPQDISVRLVGPAGQNLELLSGTGNGSAASNVNLTFDDSAAAPITPSGAVTGGTWKPSAEAGGPDPYPAPAPAVTGATTLSTFNGTNPNGVWNLYIIDGAFGDVGSLAGGWSLSIQTAMTQSVNEGDLVTIDWSAADSQPAGHTLSATLNLTGGPAPLTIQTPAPRTIQFIAPRTLVAGGSVDTFNFDIFDNNTSTTTTVAFTLNIANIVPTATASAPPLAMTGQPVALTGASVDPIEPDQLPAGGVGRQYLWSQTGGTAVSLTAGTNFRNRSFTPAVAGTYTFSLSVVDHGGFGATSAPAPTTIEVRNAAGAGTLSGVVRDSTGAALSAATVEVFSGPGTGLIGTTSTNASGLWSVAGLSNGTSYHVRFSKVGFGSRWAKDGLTVAGNVPRPVVAPSSIVDATLTSTALQTTIDGTAVNSANAPIGALMVRLVDADGVIASTITNGAGHYSFGGLTRKGRYSIQLGNGSGTFNIAWVTTDGAGAALGSTGAPNLFFSTVGGNVTVPTIKLYNKTTENRSIQVTVTFDGAPLNGTNVRVYDANGYVNGTMANVAGVYTITNLRPTNTYKVWIWTKCPGCTATAQGSRWLTNVPGEQFDQSGKLATLIDLTTSSQTYSINLT
jgi:subtilisin-like proprotein convertase family protein